MKTYSGSQIKKILQEGANGLQSTVSLCRKYGIARSTFYEWKAKYKVDRDKKYVALLELEDLNANLRQLVGQQGSMTRGLKSSWNKSVRKRLAKLNQELKKLAQQQTTLIKKLEVKSAKRKR